jgi:hypothetical protein
MILVMPKPSTAFVRKVWFAGGSSILTVRRPCLPMSRSRFKDMAAYFIEADPMKRDEIALRQLHVLRQHQRPRDKALRLSDVKATFLEMRDQA